MDFLSSGSDAIFGGGSNAFDMGQMASNIENMSLADQIAFGEQDFSAITPGAWGTDVGMSFDSIGKDIGGFLGNKQNTNMLGLGLKGAGLYNQFTGQNQANKLAKKQEARNADAYSRNVEADERRQALRF